ncbi:efflux RND transporter periplasmic adaptor subunit [Nitrococcus mobilis]|uniref:Acriflavin resistance protein n=1 Tax=Nitrococcus mobilis Nb-231 TaxID=314278 RepID=A4BMN5_9GAMM|nr:efflux RND transporter periplasmic adaptor subunit [Nitrococcus mobilis]EAR23573.1 acriflavin resistance protein [Nitrococcus mobilis Nb-231]
MTDTDLLSQLRIDPNQREADAKSRWPWLMIAAILLLALAGGGGWYWVWGRVVVVEAVAAAPLSAATADTAVLDATGYVTARREATVSSKITGKLVAVPIEEGDRVSEGQVLARLDDRDVKARLQLAHAQLAAAKAAIADLDAQLEEAQLDLDRQRALSKRGATAKQTLDSARIKVTRLRAQLKAQRAQIEVAEAQRRIAQVDLVANTIIRAPFTGVIVAKTAQPGEMVSPVSAGGGFTRTGICTIVDMSSREIEVDVNEAYINRVKPKQPVEAVLDAYPRWKIPAEVIAIIPTADRSKATVRVRIAIKQLDPRILPNMGVRVSFLNERPAPARRAPQGVVVPTTAIVQRDGHNVVFVVDQKRAQQRNVTLGQSYGDLRQIESGLKIGEHVVRDPTMELTDGTWIKTKSSGA